MLCFGFTDSVWYTTLQEKKPRDELERSLWDARGGSNRNGVWDSRFARFTVSAEIPISRRLSEHERADFKSCNRDRPHESIHKVFQATSPGQVFAIGPRFSFPLG